MTTLFDFFSCIYKIFPIFIIKKIYSKTPAQRSLLKNADKKKKIIKLIDRFTQNLKV